jgi:hypothetical protein
MKRIIISAMILALMTGYATAQCSSGIPPEGDAYTMIDGYWDLNNNGGGQLICATAVGQYGHGPANGDDTWTGDPGGDYTWGNEFDRNWVQLVYPNYGVWDLGKAYEEIVVNLNQDHGPYPAEGLEYRIWGCNDFNTDRCECNENWILGDLDRVYKHGWSTVGDGTFCDGVTTFCNDDFTGVLDFEGRSMRYIKLQSIWCSPYDEPEVDVVKGVEPEISVPEFSSIGIALIILLTAPGFAYILAKKH